MYWINNWIQTTVINKLNVRVTCKLHFKMTFICSIFQILPPVHTWYLINAMTMVCLTIPEQESPRSGLPSSVAARNCCMSQGGAVLSGVAGSRRLQHKPCKGCDSLLNRRHMIQIVNITRSATQSPDARLPWAFVVRGLY